ncbi:hypothetical protein [Shewanella litorisediminis]|uniref:Transmembrane protein n=1 Tax=Shewanella litorisediminis TaxID=1173586 RepID=A0ABX7G5Y2_9GAMM|nr:hypothetical protein [Shewanella litorisediminis]MCL2917514.1 hypothetical protein [Shewanella litorisediminis]QRH02643.1 hypothetical protein JQC75_04255 [Shewanella litorisediminis]
MAQLSLPNATAQDTSLIHLQYGLMSAFPLLLPVLFALALNLSLRKSDSCSICVTHLKWQRNSMFGLALGSAAWYWLPAGWMAATALVLVLGWFVLRVVKGWVSLIDGVAIQPAPHRKEAAGTFE